jgi:hypothetical protein
MAFYKEREKTAEKERKTRYIRQQIQSCLQIDKRPPSPFFQLSRTSLLELQRNCLLLDNGNRR